MKKRKNNEKNTDDLIIIGKIGEKKRSLQKKVQKLNELIEMRIEKKKRVKELIAKRAGVWKT